MTTDLISPIQGVASPGAVAPTKPNSALPEGSAFQRLLESLQQLRTTGAAAADAKSPEQLQDALRAADDGFVNAMDLRKKLEEAFRSRMP